MLQPSARRYAVQLLEARDLDDWENRVDQLTQAQATAVAQATAAQQNVNAQEGSRLLAARAQPSCSMPPIRIPFSAAQQMAARQDTLAAGSTVRPLAKEGGQRGKGDGRPGRRTGGPHHAPHRAME